jgi:hypothetical protein
MLAWERRDDESSKAFAAFSLYRDLGPARSLRAVAEALYGVRARYGVRTVEKWSSRFDWQDRVRALDARDEMIRRVAIEEHLKTKAADFAERQVRLRERWLTNAEKAAAQAEKMLEWPMSEQRMIREEDGEEVTYVFVPAGWSKATARTLQDMSVSAASGAVGAVGENGQEDYAALFNFDVLTDEELETLKSIYEKGFGV